MAGTVCAGVGIGRLDWRDRAFAGLASLAPNGWSLPARYCWSDYLECPGAAYALWAHFFSRRLHNCRGVIVSRVCDLRLPEDRELRAGGRWRARADAVPVAEGADMEKPRDRRDCAFGGAGRHAVGTPAREPLPDAGCAAGGSLRPTTKGSTPAEITFVNRSGRAIRTYWLNYQGKRVYYTEIPPGKSFTQQTYFRHPWVITGSASGDCMAIFLPAQKPGVAMIE